MINLELYKIFVIVAKEENLTRASEKLNLTQPAVTKHIKNLEEILQIKLFIRSNHGIKLTEEGEMLYNEIKDSVEILMNVGGKYNKVKDIRLGIHSTLLNKMFSECISDYYKTNIDSKITTFNLENEEMLLKLKNQELDIIFSKKIESNNKNENVKFINLGTWNEVLIANSNSKWKNKKISLEDVKKETIYMPKKTSETPKNFFSSINCKYEDFHNIKHITYRTIVEILKSNKGIGLITKEFMEEELKDNGLIILDTEFQIKPIEFGVYVSKRFKELNQFIEIIKKHFSNK